MENKHNINYKLSHNKKFIIVRGDIKFIVCNDNIEQFYNLIHNIELNELNLGNLEENTEEILNILVKNKIHYLIPTSCYTWKEDIYKIYILNPLNINNTRREWEMLDDCQTMEQE